MCGNEPDKCRCIGPCSRCGGVRSTGEKTNKEVHEQGRQQGLAEGRQEAQILWEIKDKKCGEYDLKNVVLRLMETGRLAQKTTKTAPLFK